jgi:hypothetical protein
MTAAQKTAKANFKKAIEYRKKTGVSLKEAFAHVYGRKVGAAPKKKATKKAAPKKAAKKVVKKAAPKKVAKKAAPKKAAKKKHTKYGVVKKHVRRVAGVKKPVSTHKDTKSHNVNIRVVSGFEKIDFTRINNDVFGNPRYVVHFIDFLNNEEKSFLPFSKKYEYALKKAKLLGGKKYDNKQYGGGVVFQSYNTMDLEKRINDLRDKTPKIKY